jgi:hypothetical protein
MIDDPRRHLLRNPQSATGLSFVEGEPVVRVADLPEHNVEVHVFVDADRAQCFVDGLSFAKANGIAWTWEPGRELGNRCVLTARLWEDRTAGETISEAVGLVHHARNDWDSRARADRDKERAAEEAASRAAYRIRMNPLRDACRDAGVKVEEAALDWMRVFAGRAVIRHVDGERYEVECDASIVRREGDDALIAEYVAHAAAGGFPLDPRRLLNFVSVEVEGAAEAVATARRMIEIDDAFAGIAKRYWHARFMETMRVTPNIRRFLAGAAKDGVSIGIVRRNPQAKAGGVLLRRTEIGRLVRAGWITSNHEYYPTKIEVTEAGLAAAGLSRAAAA